MITRTTGTPGALSQTFTLLFVLTASQAFAQIDHHDEGHPASGVEAAHVGEHDGEHEGEHEGHHEGEHEGHHEGEHEGHHEGEHETHKNILGVFLGMTHEGRRENATALGIEYERRFSDHFSSGLIVEHTFGDADFWVTAVPFYYRTGPWRLGVAPGVESSEEGDEALLRFSAGYEFLLGGGWDITPVVNVDLVDGEDVWVIGVAVGKGF